MAVAFEDLAAPSFSHLQFLLPDFRSASTSGKLAYPSTPRHGQIALRRQTTHDEREQWEHPRCSPRSHDQDREARLVSDLLETHDQANTGSLPLTS